MIVTRAEGEVRGSERVPDRGSVLGAARALSTELSDIQWACPHTAKDRDVA